MAIEWSPIPLNGKLYGNLDEIHAGQSHSALENCFINEAGGISRFWGFEVFCQLPDNGRVHLHEWRGDLVAATSKGRFYTVDRLGVAIDKTSVPVAGDRRVIFARTEDELVMTAGRKPVRFAGQETELLSPDAPDSTHCGFIDGFLLLNERDSGRFIHSPPGDTRTFEPLDTFAAEGQPDNIDGLIVTPFRELLLGGSSSFEQFERLTTGDIPFFRRWAIGEGLSAPYTLLFADNALFCVNRGREYVRFSGQVTQPVSNDIGLVLETADNWEEAWTGGNPDRPLDVFGQRFVLLQLPHALNAYGSKGLTLLYDYRNKRWSSLFGWDQSQARPVRYPIWSHWTINDETYFGGEGVIYRLKRDSYSNAGGISRLYARTGFIGDSGPYEICNLRIRVKRGVGSHTAEPSISLRVKRDNKAWSNWKQKGLGKAGRGFQYIEYGGFGTGHSFQFEIMATDDCEIEISKMEAVVEKAD
ncbi:hypothetical protein [Ferrovibrio terrae]|uniref:hypothetical protein n=1 Tax=Ferrovibrio terrae TaxID=2594003 RepID=UPI003137C30B